MLALPIYIYFKIYIVDNCFPSYHVNKKNEAITVPVKNIESLAKQKRSYMVQ